ncbi:MAG: cell wall hydrolase [Geminicoccaceae bacterium]
MPSANHWPSRCLALAALALAGYSTPAQSATGISGREVRCLALIAYTEAAVDGPDGMAAVIHVVRNRMADPRFPDDACAVVAQYAQFQPVAQSEVLQKVVRDPEGYSIPQVLKLRSPASRRLFAMAHELARAPRREPDPTGHALYFVNPELMELERCPWFAALKRTVRIGGHVFMTDYRPGEPRRAPALDCGSASAAAMP